MVHSSTLSDKDFKFDCKAAQDFARRFNIQWKCTSTYNPQGNGVAEKMVGTLKKASQKVSQSESKECDQSLEDVLCGCRGSPGTDGIVLFEILFVVKPRFSTEPSVYTTGAEVLSHTRSFKIAMALMNRAERLVPRSVYATTVIKKGHGTVRTWEAIGGI